MCAYETMRTIIFIECYLSIYMYVYLSVLDWEKLTSIDSEIWESVRIEMEASTLVQWYGSIKSLALNFTIGA